MEHRLSNVWQPQWGQFGSSLLHRKEIPETLLYIDDCQAVKVLEILAELAERAPFMRMGAKSLLQHLQQRLRAPSRRSGLPPTIAHYANHLHCREALKRNLSGHHLP